MGGEEVGMEKKDDFGRGRREGRQGEVWRGVVSHHLGYSSGETKTASALKGIGGKPEQRKET